MTAQHDLGHDVGPLADEAAKLVAALGEWAQQHAPSAGPVGGSEECALCPVCQLLRLARHAKPETFAHLLEASAALTAALRSVVEPHPAGPARGVQRIDLDDDR